jgi:DNA-binding transcriptional MerR regulator
MHGGVTCSEREVIDLTTIKEYAQTHGVSYEAIRRQVSKHQDELAPHIVREGRTQFLTDDGVAVLDRIRANNPVIVMQQDETERVQALELERQQLQERVIQLQEQVISLQSQMQELEHSNVLLLQQQIDQQEQATGGWLRRLFRRR